MENMEFIQRQAIFDETETGNRLEGEFHNIVPIIVPVFDGVSAMSESMKCWIEETYPNILYEVEDDVDSNNRLDDSIEVTVMSRKWWYYGDDTSEEVDDDKENKFPVRKREKIDSQSNRNIDGRSHSINITRKRGPKFNLPIMDHSLRASFSGEMFTMPLYDDDEKSNHDDDDNIFDDNEEFERASLMRRRYRNQLVNVVTEQMTKDGLAASGYDMDNITYFHMVPVIKRNNHRKHNSHHWFFEGICAGLDEKVMYAFLTDCGTTFNPNCIGRLMFELSTQNHLIGVTARQRVEPPSCFFHPCLSSPFPYLRGTHTEFASPPCWKCYAAFLLSPAPLQGFEFEATLIMNSSMFNLVEALPVLPGPCQLLNFPKMKKYGVVKQYFRLLFKDNDDDDIIDILRSASMSEEPSFCFRDTTTSLTNSISSFGSNGVTNHGLNNGTCNLRNSFDATTDEHQPMLPSTLDQNLIGDPHSHILRKLGFQDFLRLNMRLAEDRILSFVSVFCTGYGTKWIPGATFYYQPEIRWTTLLSQRRRWLNGTFASYLYFFTSKMVYFGNLSLVKDDEKAMKSFAIVNAFWSLQLLQLILVCAAPAIFGASIYMGLYFAAQIEPTVFDWSNFVFYAIGKQDSSNELSVTAAHVWVGFFLVSYILWSIISFRAEKGKLNEILCIGVSIMGFLLVLPLYYATWYYIILGYRIEAIGVIMILVMLLPVALAIPQSRISATLYLLYLPWFLFLATFFLVFIPTYSMARIWDTTWGNRLTGADKALTKKIESVMKHRSAIFLAGITLFNCIFTIGLLQLYRHNYTYRLAATFFLFSPTIIQMVMAFIFVYIVHPIGSFWRSYHARRNNHRVHPAPETKRNRSDDEIVNAILLNRREIEINEFSI